MSSQFTCSGLRVRVVLCCDLHASHGTKTLHMEGSKRSSLTLGLSRDTGSEVTRIQWCDHSAQAMIHEPRFLGWRGADGE
eukprot:4640286-Amphidinium_carterae.1